MHVTAVVYLWGIPPMFARDIIVGGPWRGVGILEQTGVGKI